MLFQSSGNFIGVNVIVMVVFIIDTIRLKLTTTKAMQYAILMGWIIMLLKLGRRTNDCSDGTYCCCYLCPACPLSTEHHCRRFKAAHFFGLHALQIIPLFAIGFKT